MGNPVFREMNTAVTIDSKTLETLIKPTLLIPHLLSTLPSRTSQINSPPRLSYPISQSNSTANNLLLIMPSWSTSPSLPYIGLKILTSYPHNSPSLSSTFSLFNSLTGLHLASIDASSLTNLRTASVSALAATFLAPADSEIVLIVGCGSLAPYLVNAYRAAFPSVSRFVVWNRDKDKSVALASHFRDLQGNAHGKVIYEHTENLDEAIKTTDIIVCATGSNTPLVKGVLVKDGAHLNLVGSFKKDMKECDDEAVRRGRLFVDVEAAVEEAGELVGAIERGVIENKDIIGNLVDLVGGKVVGRKEGKVTVFKSVGSAVFDLLAAQLAYETYMKDYSYDDIIDGSQNPSPSGTPDDWNIAMEERHYAELHEHNMENRMERERQQHEWSIEEHHRNQDQLERIIPHNQEDDEVQSLPILCRCGYIAAIFVIRFGQDIGRRYLRCDRFPNGCEYFEWMDERLTRRAIEYTTELENEITSLRNQLSALHVQAPRRSRRNN